MADSSILASLAVRISGETADFEAALKRSRTALTSFVGTVNADLAKSFDKIDEQTKKLEKGFGRLGDSLQSAGRTLSVSITAPLALLGVSSIKASGEIDSLRRALATMEGSAAKTEARMKELREVAKLPGLGFAEAVQGDVRLRAVGISADLAKRALLAFGNAIATTGGGRSELAQVTVQLSQLSAKGKVLAQDLRPIIEAAPAVATALKKLYGTVDSETISKSLEKQGKSSMQFIEILTNELAKLPKVTGGLKNAMENFGDSSQQAFARFGDAINKTFNVEGKINALGDTLGNLAESFANLSPLAQGAILTFGGLAAAAGPVLLAIGAMVSAIPTLIAGFTALKAAVSGLIGPLGLLTAGLTVAAALYIKNKEGIDFLVASMDEIGRKNAVPGLAAQVKSLTGDFTEVAKSAKAAGQDITTALKAASAQQENYFRPKLIAAQKELDDYIAKNGGVFNNLSRNLRTATEEGKAYKAQVEKLSGAVALYSGILNKLPEIRVAARLAADAKEAEKQVEAVTGRLEALRQQQQKLTEQRELIPAGPNADKLTAVINNQIKAIDKEIERILALGAAQEKVFQLLSSKNTLRLSSGQTTTATGGKVDAISPFAQKPDVDLVNPNRFFDVEGLRKASEKVDALVRKMSKSIKSSMDEINKSISNTINGGIADAITGLATKLGEAAAGAKVSAGQFAAALVGPLGDILIKLGGIALGVALGVEGITVALQSLNPYAALAAGVALIALGAAAKSGAAALATPGGAGGGQRSGPTVSSSGLSSGNSTGTIQLVGVLKGSDIYLSGQREATRRQRGGG